MNKTVSGSETSIKNILKGATLGWNSISEKTRKGRCHLSLYFGCKEGASHAV